MKNLSDFKRAMKLGSKWLRKHASDDYYSERTVSKVCCDYVRIKDKDGNECRLDFPKACNFQINEDGEAEIFWPPVTRFNGVEYVEIPKRLILTYKLISN